MSVFQLAAPKKLALPASKAKILFISKMTISKLLLQEVDGTVICLLTIYKGVSGST